MTQIQDLSNDMGKLKNNLDKLIEGKKFDLGDINIVKASEELNKHINEYNNLISQKFE